MRVALLTALVLLAAPAAAEQPAAIAGPAEAVDGDTLQIAGATVGLHGIDAFEATQTCGSPPWACGAEAARALAELVAGRRVECIVTDMDAPEGPLARCRANDRDLGSELVRRGLALADRRASRDYAPEETFAEASRAGAWSGDFEPPWRWRRREWGDEGGPLAPGE